MSVPLVYHPSYSFPFPGRHRFPMEKFRLLHERLRDGGVAGAANLHRPGRARPALLSLAHCPEYLDRFLGNRLGEREAKRMGLPWSEDLVRRTCIAPMGTLLTAQLALKHGIACHLAGAQRPGGDRQIIENAKAGAEVIVGVVAVSYTHLTLPTILRV